MKRLIRKVMKFLTAVIVCYCFFAGEIHAVEAQSVIEIYCPSCETQIEEEDNFCSYCGEQLKEKENNEDLNMQYAAIGIMGILLLIAVVTNIITNKEKKSIQ